MTSGANKFVKRVVAIQTSKVLIAIYFKLYSQDATGNIFSDMLQERIVNWNHKLVKIIHDNK